MDLRIVAVVLFLLALLVAYLAIYYGGAASVQEENSPNDIGSKVAGGIASVLVLTSIVLFVMGQMRS